MNLFKEAIALWRMKALVENEIKGARMDTASGKPGWKTTEFWIKIATVDLPAIYLAVKGFLPPKDALIIELAAGAIYGIYRTVAKAVADIQAAKAAS